MSSIHSRPIVPYAVACLAIATFACMDAVMKGLSIEIGAYNAMLWRSVTGLVMSGAIFAIRNAPLPDRPTMILHIKRSVAAGVSVLLFFWGLVRVPMAEGVALTFLAPIIALFLAAILLGEKIGRNAIGASLLAFAGVLVIVAGKAGAGSGPEAVHGALAIMLASLFYAYNLVLLRRSALVAGPIEITFFTNLVFAGLYAVGAPFLAIVPELHYVPRLCLAAGLAIISSLLLSWAYARAEAQRLVSVEYSAFVWAAILGAVIFGEKVLPLTILGAAMIIGGCVIAMRGKAAPGPATEAAS